MKRKYFIGDPCYKCEWVSFTENTDGRIVCNSCHEVICEGELKLEIAKTPDVASPTTFSKGTWDHTTLNTTLIKEEDWFKEINQPDTWSLECDTNAIIELHQIDLTFDLEHIRLFNNCIKATTQGAKEVDKDTKERLKIFGIELVCIAANHDISVLNSFQGLNVFSNANGRQHLDAVVIRTLDGHYFIAGVNTHRYIMAGDVEQSSKAALKLALMLTTINPTTAGAYR